MSRVLQHIQSDSALYPAHDFRSCRQVISDRKACQRHDELEPVHLRCCSVILAANSTGRSEHAGAGDRKQVADHQTLHRQEKIFQRQGVQISRKTMGGWLPPVAELFNPLYQAAKNVLFESKVIGTDDTGVEGARPEAAVCSDRPHLGICRRCSPSGVGL